ncbi:sugar ABC transporter substrate-binding protein [Sinomonas sp. JGH33]|uniref:Sugar ABC transporter substrate-binding protein n=1 Tax=Sinomonas terricola TaxID=3110330 RepID=A0ABU5T7C6_9MICC|nr:sugar ABC transporter substrate-binding protein [Sinomonas sp. JGH33]MEA5455498.1 sugar ABC transporter substrate-binding protein [Sinomonas sp. JGH33]
MRKEAFVAGALALGLLGLAGCGGGSSPTTADGKTAMTWAMWVGGTEDQNGWQKVADEVSAKLGDVKITLQGSTFSDYFTKMSTQLSSNTAPCLVAVQSLRTAQLKDGMLPLDDLVKQDGMDLGAFDQSMIKGLSADGKLYALPYDVGPLMMFYNKDKFAAAGVSEPKAGWTADEFVATAKKITASSGKPAFATPIWDLSVESQVLAYNGGRVTQEDGSLDAANSTFADGLQWVADLTGREKIAPQLPGSDSSFASNQFLSGTTAMSIDGPWSLIDTKSKAKFKVGVTTLPAGPGGGKTFSAGSGWGISKQCPTPDKAFAALKEMTGDKVLSELGAAGRALPARTADQKVWIDNAGIPGVEEALKAASANAVPMPSNTNSDQLGTLFSQYLPKALNGQQSAASVMKDVAAQLPH